MFTAAEFRLVKSNCLSKMENLLKNLAIAVPDWNSGDEFQIYDKLDNEITNKVCQLMKSSSIIDGYTMLLKVGGLSYGYDETDNELLEKIVKNREKIIQGIEKNAEQLSQFSSTPQPLTLPQSTPPSQMPTHSSAPQTFTKEETVTLMGPIVVGILFIVSAIVLMILSDEGSSPVISIVLAALGIVGIAFGAKGEKRRVTVTRPATSQPTATTPQSISQPVSQPRPQQKSVKRFPLSVAEVKNVLDVLAQINNIVKAI